MQRSLGTFFSILIAATLILLAVAIPAINLDTRVVASPAAAGRGAAPPGWRLASPVTYQNLTIFPVVSGQDSDTTDFVTLDQGLASGDVVVSELGNYMRRTRDGEIPPVSSRGPQVNQLVLINRGKKPLLLLAGEVVSGGKQDRIIGKDRIVPIGAAPLALDVFCVEHGRWTGASEQFSAGNAMVYPSVRNEAAVNNSQVQVWSAVRGEAKNVGNVPSVAAGAPPPVITTRELSDTVASSGSQSYQKIYNGSRIGSSVEGVAEEISRRFSRATSGLKGERPVGVVVAFGDEVAWSDIFASSELFNAYWPKLLRSYVVEAMTRPGVRQVASLDDARDFLRPINGHIEQESEPGVYEWRKQSVGHLSEIQLAALAPKPLTLHYLRVLGADERGVMVR